MTAPILCCGEALIDLVPERPDAPALIPRPGGAALTCAIALARLGQPVALVAGVSTDHSGARLVRALEADNVRTDLLIRSDLPSTLAHVHLSDGDATYSFHDTATAGRAVTPVDVPKLPAASALVFGGISLARLPSAETFVRLAETAEVRGPVLLDPNIRPALIDDAAAYRATLARAVVAADIVKLSEEDLEWLGTSPQALLDLGPSLVLLTRGAEGVMAIEAAGQFTVRAPVAQVVDTVGAGDTFVAGFLAGRSEGMDLCSSLAFATTAASLSTVRVGADPPYLSAVRRAM
ncbi:MAG: carbohydrate kinase [Pseudomonadota bacterium]